MSETSPADKPLDARVREVIESVRPYIQADGGDIELVAIEGDVVKVKLRGVPEIRTGESGG
jgi:Fe-S cluster biogenesis protein NfuA